MLRNPLLSIPGFLFLFSVSCGPEEPEDREDPVITVVSPTENARVKGLMNVLATAEDRSKNISMQLYLDGTLLDSVGGTEISTTVNTTTLEEGIHRLRVIAMDNEGNASEKDVVFQKRALLFKLDVSSNYIESPARIFFTLSKNDGTIMHTGELENGQSYSFPTPADFNPDSSFVYTEYFYLYNDPDEFGYGYLIKAVNSYAGIKAETFKSAEYPVSPQSTHTHLLTVTDVPADHEGYVSGTNVSPTYGNFTNGSTIEHNVWLQGSTSDMLFTLSTQDMQLPSYQYFNSIQANGSTSFSANDMTPMSLHTINTTHPSGYFSAQIMGETTAGKPYHVSTSAADFNGGSFGIPYVPNWFTKQYLYMYYDVLQETFTNRISSSSLPTSFQYVEATLEHLAYNFDTGLLSVNTTGTFDQVTIAGGNSWTEGTFLYITNYSVTFPQGTDQHVVLPNAPPLLNEYQFPSRQAFSFWTTAFYDYPELAGEDDYHQNVVFAADGVGRFFRDHVSHSFVSMPHEGRKDAQKDFGKKVTDIMHRYVPHWAKH